MAEDGSKISFGFSKSVKKVVLKNAAPKKIEYIECLDEKAIKIIGKEERDEPLVIPMLGSRTWHERIINKIDADIFEPKVVKAKEEEDSQLKTKREIADEIPNGKTNLTDNIVCQIDWDARKKEAGADEKATLDEQAAREIISDLQAAGKEATEKEVFALPVLESQTLQGGQEPTLDDYEHIPIDAFGIAMLRGMGWQPGKGIGKNAKVTQSAVPELRPKGLGLGADKATLQKQSAGKAAKEEEQLKLVKGTFVKFLVGKHVNSYGEITGLDDDAGRLIVKMALGGNVLSVNEFTVQPVTKGEYTKNGKVLNADTYEKYKSKVAAKDEDEDDSPWLNRPCQDRGQEEKAKRKKSKKRSSRSSAAEGSDSDGKSRKRKDRENGHDYRSSSKSKKHKQRDGSCERSSKKSRQKSKTSDKDDYERERRRRKKHGRSHSPRRR